MNASYVGLRYFSGNVIEAVRHARSIRKSIGLAQSMDSTELYAYAKELQVMSNVRNALDNLLMRSKYGG